MTLCANSISPAILQHQYLRYLQFVMVSFYDLTNMLIIKNLTQFNGFCIFFFMFHDMFHFVNCFLFGHKSGIGDEHGIVFCISVKNFNLRVWNLFDFADNSIRKKAGCIQLKWLIKNNIFGSIQWWDIVIFLHWVSENVVYGISMRKKKSVRYQLAIWLVGC